jgi:hypothetical protein
MLLNLGVPIIGAIFTLALVAPTHGSRVARTLIAASVKDGQLFWCAIGLCAAAVYEAVTALERGSGEVPMPEFAIAVFSVPAFSCSMPRLRPCCRRMTNDKTARCDRLRR